MGGLQPWPFSAPSFVVRCPGEQSPRTGGLGGVHVSVLSGELVFFHTRLNPRRRRACRSVASARGGSTASTSGAGDFARASRLFLPWPRCLPAYPKGGNPSQEQRAARTE